jgi:hypothetical protein
MKSFTNRLMVFAASAVVLGTMAYGQTMKAEIPFAFQTANATLPAGNYTINRLNTANSTMRIYNTDLNRSVLVSSLPVDAFHRAEVKPVLVFACSEERCSLREIKTSNGTYSYPAAHKAARDREAVSLIEIPLTPRNGD